MRYWLVLLLLSSTLLFWGATAEAQEPTNTTEPTATATPQVETEPPPAPTANAAPLPTATPVLGVTPVSTTAVELPNLAFTFKDLGYNTITIQGAFGSAQIYVPVPGSWQATRDAEVSLHITSSPLLRPISNLTVLVNNQPVTSTALGAAGTEQTLDFTIPADLITPPGMLIQFQGYLRVTEEVCEDSNIPGQWLRVTGDSSLALHMALNDELPQLSDLASLLFSRGLDGTPHELLIVLPAAPDNVTLNTAIQVAAGLGKLAGDFTYPVKVVTAENVTEENFARANVVLLGLPADQPWLALLGDWVSTLGEDGIFYTADRMAVPPTDAVFQLARSTWNDERHVLVVSANHLDGLATAGAVFLDPPTVRSLDGNYVFSTGPLPYSNEILPAPWSGTQTSLEQLGFDSRTVRGAGIFSEYFTIFREPGVIIDRGTQFVLQGTASTLLDNSESYIAVFLNEIPLGTYSTRTFIENQALAFRIPTAIDEKELHQRLNLRIEISNQVAHEECKTIDRDNAWVQLDGSSFFEVNSLPLPLPDLRAFPAPFTTGDPVLMVLPDAPATEHLAGAIRLGMLLGFASPAAVDIQAVPISDLDAMQADQHLMFLLDAAQAPRIDALFAALAAEPAEIDPAATPEPLAAFSSEWLDLLDMALYQNLDGPFGLIFTDVMPGQAEQQVVLILTSETTGGFTAGIDGLFQTLPPVAVSGTIAIAQPDKYLYVLYNARDVETLTAEVDMMDESVQVTPESDDDQAETDASDDETPLTSLDASLVIIIIPIMVSLSLILAIWAFQRRSR